MIPGAVRHITLVAFTAAGIALSLAIVYAWSIPDAFNTKQQNRVFFDSDGAFITRQFRQGRIRTHNDHLLYHVLARLSFDYGRQLGIQRDPVTVHKIQSVLFGALGVATLFFGGWWWTKRLVPALAAALFVGGCASYWFFAATIDTYIPHLWAASTALVLALICLRTQRVVAYAALGVAIGVAFLFRTDGFLCGLLAVVLLSKPARPWARLTAFALASFVVGVVGYAALANYFYGVPPTELVSWAFHSLDRPEVTSNTAGQWSNITGASLQLVLINHVMYSVLIPGVMSTRSGPLHYSALAAGWIAPLVWLVTLVTALIVLGHSVAKGGTANRERAWLLGIAGLWLLPRVILYTWWSPKDPFLFAALSLPAFWLLLIGFAEINANQSSIPLGFYRFSVVVQYPTLLLILLATAVWLHNSYHLIRPLLERG